MCDVNDTHTHTHLTTLTTQSLLTHIHLHTLTLVHTPFPHTHTHTHFIPTNPFHSHPPTATHQKLHVLKVAYPAGDRHQPVVAEVDRVEIQGTQLGGKLLEEVPTA